MEELIAIVSVSVALATLIIAQGRSLRRDFSARMDRMEVQIAESRDRAEAQNSELREHIDTRIGEQREHIDTRIGEQREHVDTRIGELRARIGDLVERMAHLEGLLEGLREAITRTRVA